MDELTSIFNYRFKDVTELETIHSFHEVPENVVVMEGGKKIP